MVQQLIDAIRQYNRQAWLFFLIIVALGFAVDGVYTVLLNLYLLRLEYGTEFIGLINAAGLLTFALTSLPAGILGSRWSNTLMIRIGVIILLIGGILLPLAEFTPDGWQDVWLIVNYSLMFCGFSLFFVNGAPFLMNVVEAGKSHGAFAVQTALLSLAGFIGSFIGGAVPELLVSLQGLTLDDPMPYRVTLMIVSVVLIFALGLAFTLKEPVDESAITPSEQETDSPVHPTRAKMEWTMPFIILILVMSLVRLFQVAGSATVVVYFNVYMDTQLHITTGVIGIISAIGKLIGVPTALIVPAMVRRWGNGQVVIAGALATAVFLLPIALVENWIVAAIGFIGVLAMNSIRFTAFIVYMLELVPKVQQSVMSGSGEMAGGFSFSMMALGGGIILSLFTFRDLFLLGSIFTVLGTFVFWLHFRQSNTKRKVKPAL